MLLENIRPFIPAFVLKPIAKAYHQQQYKKWLAAGSPIPPPHIVKQKAIQYYGKQFNCAYMVETGTYRGAMVEAQKNNFKKVYSIELSEALHAKAKQRFKTDKQVVLVQGDSGKMLPTVMETLDAPTLFWLDGHYSAGVTARGEKDCPIYEEIDAIFNAKRLPHVLLIDDARCFNGTNDYPTIADLTQYIASKNSNYSVAVKDDIIIYTPN